MLPSNVWALAAIGGLALSGMGAAAQKMSDTTITITSVGRDFFAGALIVIVLGFLIPDSFKGLGLSFPSLSFPISLSNSGELEIQVDPRL